jgi:hypothetical protein
MAGVGVSGSVTGFVEQNSILTKKELFAVSVVSDICHGFIKAFWI